MEVFFSKRRINLEGIEIRKCISEEKIEGEEVRSKGDEKERERDTDRQTDRQIDR